MHWWRLIADGVFILILSEELHTRESSLYSIGYFVGVVQILTGFLLLFAND